MDAIKFPALCCTQDILLIEHSFENLTTCSRVALRKQFYNNMKLIDSNLKLFEIEEARKIKGLGPFWGWNIFLNQKIKVELFFKKEINTVSLKEVKEMVFYSFKKWHGWRSRGDYKELIRRVRDAKDIAELIKALSE